MTTLTQLDKIASKWFHNEMRRRGFAIEKNFTFWRKRGPLYDLFRSRILTGRSVLRVDVTIWTPFVEHETGEITTFPPDSMLIGGHLGEEFPETMFGGTFDVGEENMLEATLREILQVIDLRALPWFHSINSCETYNAYVGDHGFYPTPEAEQHIKNAIARAFDCEPPLW